MSVWACGPGATAEWDLTPQRWQISAQAPSWLTGWISSGLLEIRTTEVQHWRIGEMPHFQLYIQAAGTSAAVLSFGVPRSNLFVPLMPGWLSSLCSCSTERNLGKVSYSSVTRWRLAPGLRWVFALMLPIDEVALISVQYAVRLLCKIPLNWARHAGCLSEGDFHCWVWGSDSIQVILEY